MRRPGPWWLPDSWMEKGVFAMWVVISFLAGAGTFYYIHSVIIGCPLKNGF